MKKVLFEGKFKRLISEDGWEYTERIWGNGVVAVIAVTDEGKIVFVEQYRVPVEKNVVELPAGISNDLAHLPEESLEAAARRELLEEAGYEAKEMTLIAQGPSSAASLSDVINLFWASGLKKVSAGGGDHTESIVVHEVDYGQVEPWLEQMRLKGCYVDPKVYSALYLIQNKIEKMKGKNKL